jgi:Tfp pilus assembly protein PilN
MLLEKTIANSHPVAVAVDKEWRTYWKIRYGSVQTDLERRQQIHRSLGAGKPIHAAILKELSNILPQGVYVRSLSFDRPEGVPSMQLGVDIYGGPVVRAMTLKQKLVAALEDSPFFVNVSFAPTSEREQRPGRRAERTSRGADESLELSCQVLGFPGGPQ